MGEGVAIGTVLLSALTLALAVFALTRRRLLWGIIGVGAHSLALAGVYLFLSAPDVALTQAAIGFGLVTFIYLLALRRTGRLIVVAVECTPLLYQDGERVAGLEWEILTRFARQVHQDLDVIWVPRAEIARYLSTGEAEIAAGGILPREADRLLLSRPVLSTRLVVVRRGPGPLGAVAGGRGEDHLPSDGQTFEDHARLVSALRDGEIGGAIADLLHVRDWVLSDLIQPTEVSGLEDLDFRFAVSPTAEDLHRSLDALLAELDGAGELARLARRYVG